MKREKISGHWEGKQYIPSQEVITLDKGELDLLAKEGSVSMNEKAHRFVVRLAK